jgi:hypothetical protein
MEISIPSTLVVMWKRIKKFFRKQSPTPFQACFAFFCIYSGIAGLLTFGVASDVLREVLGFVLSVIFNVVYIVAGVSLYFGLGLNNRNLEAFGLILIFTSLFVRSLTIFYLVGFDPAIFSTYVYSIAFMIACVVRFSNLLKGKYLKEPNSLEFVRVVSNKSS